MACDKCEHCGNRYHWSHAFSKFGYDDGDGKIGTSEVAELLESEGYEVCYGRWLAHNTLIFSIKKEDILQHLNTILPFDGLITYHSPAPIVLDDTTTKCSVGL